MLNQSSKDFSMPQINDFKSNLDGKERNESVEELMY